MRREAVSSHFPEVWEKGGEGGIELAQKVIDTIENKESNFHSSL